MGRTIDEVYDKVVEVELQLCAHISAEECTKTQSRKWQDYAANLLTGVIGGLVVWLAGRFKTILVVSTLSLLALQAHAQTTITLTGNANWSTCKSGTGAPAAVDAINLAAYTITLDGTNTAYTCAAISTTGAGHIALGSSSSATMTLSVGTLSAGSTALLVYSGTGTIYAQYIQASNSNASNAVTCASPGVCTISGSPASHVRIVGSNSSSAAAVGNSSTLNLLYADITGGSSSATTAVGLNNAAIALTTNCNFINTSGGACAFNGLSPTIVSSVGTNYVQFPTPTGTINMPAAATIVGPWPIVNANGQISRIGIYPIGQDPQGRWVLIGVGTIH